MAKQLAASGIG